jgi:hypothetical protein
MRAGRIACIGLLALVVGPREAQAANAQKPRVPVVWTEAQCLTIVDQSATDVVHFEYTIPNEETYDRTDDEVEDSRTHQFFAFGAQRWEASPPRWITWADIERAAAVDGSVVPTAISDEDVLETTTRWDPSEWVRITPDDMRVPITFDQAGMGVDWDVTGVAPGTWLVKGYTWEPLNNLWETRWAALKIVASTAEAEAAGPSVILTPDEALLETGLPHALPGCVDAPPGSTLTLEYGEVEGTLEPAWQVAQTDLFTETGPLMVAFTPPDDVAGSVLALRITITDPGGARYVAYSPAAYAVMAGPQMPDDGGSGEGCRIATPAIPAMPLLLVLLGLRRRRSGATLRS